MPKTEKKEDTTETAMDLYGLGDWNERGRILIDFEWIIFVYRIDFQCDHRMVRAGDENEQI